MYSHNSTQYDLLSINTCSFTDDLKVSISELSSVPLMVIRLRVNSILVLLKRLFWKQIDLTQIKDSWYALSDVAFLNKQGSIQFSDNHVFNLLAFGMKRGIFVLEIFLTSADWLRHCRLNVWTFQKKKFPRITRKFYFIIFEFLWLVKIQSSEGKREKYELSSWLRNDT